MMPVPGHLRDCLIPDKPEIDETELTGKLRCPCGSEEFHLLYPGQTNEYHGQKFPCTAEIKGSYFFLIRVVCTSCGKDHLLIDQDYHGWNGFVCHDEGQASKPRPELSVWNCPDCSSTSHSATVSIQTQGKEDFLDEAGEEFDEERWPDAFESFSMGIRCTGCGRVTSEWVSLETM